MNRYRLLSFFIKGSNNAHHVATLIKKDCHGCYPLQAKHIIMQGDIVSLYGDDVVKEEIQKLSIFVAWYSKERFIRDILHPDQNNLVVRKNLAENIGKSISQQKTLWSEFHCFYFCGLKSNLDDESKTEFSKKNV